VLANLAYPQDCAVWFGLEPDEKYAPSPLLTIFLRTSIEHPVFFANSTEFSAETEVAVLKTLSQHCEKVLDGFSSTIEMDEYELKTTEPFSNRMNILNMLIGEKKTLLFYRELGIFVNKIWEETKSVNKVGRFLRKHPEFYNYYNVYWCKLHI